MRFIQAKMTENMLTKQIMVSISYFLEYISHAHSWDFISSSQEQSKDEVMVEWVCMYICVCMCVYVCVYLHVCVCVFTHMHLFPILSAERYTKQWDPSKNEHTSYSDLGL